MKKCILLFVTVYLLFPYSVFAAEDLLITPSSKTSQRNELRLLTTESSLSATSVPVSSRITKRIERLISFLNISIVRLTQISSRLSSRREKIGKTGMKVTSLTTKQNTLTQQVTRTKQDMKKLEELSVIFLSDTTQLNTYQTFRTQLGTILGELNTLLKSEKELMVDMKQYEVSPSGGVKIIP